MALRPRSARWFEIVVPETDADDAMEALARQGRVQFEWLGEHGDSGRLQMLEESVRRFRTLAERYERYWPPPVFDKRCCTLPIDVSLRAALRPIERWLELGAPLLARIDGLNERLRTLSAWQPVLAVLAREAPMLDLRALQAAGPVLSGVCLLRPCSADTRTAAAESAPIVGEALQIAVDTDAGRVWLGLVPAEEQERLCDEHRRRGGECLPIPDWLDGTARNCAAGLPERMCETERALGDAERELRGLAEARGLGHAVGTLQRIDWFCETARQIRCDGRYCWITGWTADADVHDMNRALHDVGLQASVALTEAPADARRPSVLRHPNWLAPFALFTRAVGVPGVTEADPTTWVALLVPLLFGYMCGDVGHGAVIAAAGLLLRRRTRVWPLLVVCGLAAMIFGFAYGEIFGYGHLIEPLWVRPLDEPLLILTVPLPFGALVLSVGLLLHTVQSCWRGLGRSEGVADAAQLLVYWGILLTLIDARWLWLVIAGMVLCVGNRLWTARAPLAVAAGLGHLAESTFSLVLNTLSFARVGAFALAHAALQTAVLAIAGGASGLVATAIVVVLGNLVVIVLEGLVVSIQTSRLVLFEFFVRFFEGSGRGFEPAAMPPAARSGAAQRFPTQGPGIDSTSG